MPDRHKTKPKAVRMPDGLEAWYRERAAEEGQPVNSLLVAALEEYRARHDGATTPVIGYLIDGKVWHPSDVTIVRAAEDEQPARRNCKHRNMKLGKGVCPDCQEWVPGSRTNGGQGVSSSDD